MRYWKKFPNIKFDIIVIDHNSKKDDLKIIERQLNKSNLTNSIINLDMSEFTNGIKKINAKILVSIKQLNELFVFLTESLHLFRCLNQIKLPLEDSS